MQIVTAAESVGANNVLKTIPEAAAQEAIQSFGALPGAQLTAVDMPFFNILLQGKTKLDDLFSGLTAQSSPDCDDESADSDGESDTELSAECRMLQSFGLPLMGAIEPQAESTLNELNETFQTPPEYEGTSDLNIQAKEPNTSPKEAIPAGYSESNEKITENIAITLKSLGGQDSAENTFGKAAAKREDSHETSTLAGFSPTAETYFTDISDKTDDDQLKSDAVERALNRFADDLREVGSGNSEIRIVLEPESLGALKISVSHGANGISAKIISDDKGTCAIISEHIQRLIDSIEDKGIKVEKFDVAFGQTGQDSGFTENNSNNSGKYAMPQNYLFQNEEKMPISDRAFFFDAWHGISDFGHDVGGTVEYRI
ncbi:MAG: flagellar hook-length control protein FliK [Oscillospiraceae bacterium]